MLALIPSLLNLASMYRSQAINQAKWSASGIDSYEMTVRYQFAYLSSESHVQILDNQVRQITGDPPFNSVQKVEALQDFFPGCALLFPLNLCSIEYNEQYGYPQKFVSRCPMPECYSEIEITEFEVIE
jgi:hypothetical protein